METRQNAEELHKYLDFADIDWHNMKDTDFEKVNFGSSTLLPHHQKRLTDSKIYEEILSQDGNFSFGSANLRSGARHPQQNNLFESTDQWMIHNPSPKRNNKQHLRDIKQLRPQEKTQ